MKIYFPWRSLREDWWYLGITILCQNTHFICKIFQYIPVSFGHTTLAHILNGYEIYFNRTIYQISMCKISNIGCAPAFHSHLRVFWYPDYEHSMLNIIRVRQDWSYSWVSMVHSDNKDGHTFICNNTKSLYPEFQLPG